MTRDLKSTSFGGRPVTAVVRPRREYQSMTTATGTSPIVDDPQGSWISDCPACGKSFDISEVGYRRVNAYSYGLRRSMTCPKCHATNGMYVKHVDRNGVPDQPLGYVLRKALTLHAKIWGTFLLVAAAVRFGVPLLIELMKSR